MKDLKAAVGRVAVSKAGRDKNRCFLICEIVDDEFVLVVDGALRMKFTSKIITDGRHIRNLWRCCGLPFHFFIDIMPFIIYLRYY